MSALKIRIKFAKTGVMKFIGHLDIMRYFQKAMKRAEIDIAYSGGYSPHQIMSFAAPLGVGITSQGEYLDIEVNQVCSSAAAIAALNSVMVDGVEVLSYKKLPDNGKNAMSLVSAADYFIYPKQSTPGFSSEDTVRDQLKAFFDDRDEILITKKTKKNEVLLNLKDCVYQLKPFCMNDHQGIFMQLATGSTENIKPGLVMAAFFEFLKKDYVETDFQEHRLEVYANLDGTFYSLDSLGENIE
ncbi:MAG: TIGR03936 family radical SAM-associated protein [Lachnospiraceae bacterium]